MPTITDVALQAQTEALAPRGRAYHHVAHTGCQNVKYALTVSCSSVPFFRLLHRSLLTPHPSPYLNLV